jgi:transposase
MLEAMIAGVDDPAALAALADGRVKATETELREALTGRFGAHHGFLATVHLDLIDSYTAQIDLLEERIQGCLAGQDAHDQSGGMVASRDLLTTIPGISTITAERIIAEIGTDMTVFPTAARRNAVPGTLTSKAPSV